MSFNLPQLEYSYDALEPHIDARTMEIHYSKHHQGYTNKLNAAIEGSEHESKDILDILGGLDMSNMALRNNAGGYYNHKLFWEVMNPNRESVMSDGLKSAINDTFGSFDNLKLAWLHRDDKWDDGLVIFLSESKHKIKKKAEQAACKLAIDSLK